MKSGAVVAAVISAVVTVQALAAESRRAPNLTPVVDSVRERHSSLTFQGAAHADGVMYVSVEADDGALVFESTYPVRKDDGLHVEWRFYGKSQIFASNRVPAELMPTLRGMTLAAKDIVRMASSGKTPDKLKPRADDSWGCDVSEWMQFQCTDKGNCCDSHDECYWAYDCSYWSWLGVSNFWCELCNAKAVACVTTGVGSTGAPSACCAQGNCGVERCPGLQWNDPWCIVVRPSGPPEGGFQQYRDIAPSDPSGFPGSGEGVPDGTATSTKCCYNGVCNPCV